jgi:hypothetical protein
MAARKRVLKYKTENHRELMKRLLEERPRRDPARELFFVSMRDKMKSGRLSESEREKFVRDFTELRKEMEEEERGGGLKRPGKKYLGGNPMALRNIFARRGAEAMKRKEGKMEIKKQKKDWKMVEDSLVLYKNAMEKTGHLPPAERAKVLKKVEGIIFERVKKTYNDNAEKQSLAHQKLYKMTADLAMERMRLKK